MYSIEFTTQGRSRCMSVRFWKGDSLVRVELHRHDLLESTPGSYLGAISFLLSFIPSKPNLVSISGCTSMVFQALESSGLIDYGIQYPFRFDVFSLRKLMHPSVLESCYVFGPVDIFAQLTFLVAFLNGCTDQPWALQCPELIKVCFCWFLSLGSLLLFHKSPGSRVMTAYSPMLIESFCCRQLLNATWISRESPLCAQNLSSTGRPSMSI